MAEEKSTQQILADHEAYCKEIGVESRNIIHELFMPHLKAMLTSVISHAQIIDQCIKDGEIRDINDFLNKLERADISYVERHVYEFLAALISDLHTDLLRNDDGSSVVLEQRKIGF